MTEAGSDSGGRRRETRGGGTWWLYLLVALFALIVLIPFYWMLKSAHPREGDVFTLEPGLYEPAEGYGVRLEDLVHLGPEGLENLTPLPYALDPRAW